MNTGFAICGFFGAYYGIGKRLEYFLFHSDSFHKALFVWLPILSLMYSG